MLDHVFPPNIDDECDLRPQRRDVSEILLRRNAEIHAAGRYPFQKIRKDLLESHLIRHEHLKSKRAARLREIGNHLPVGRIGDGTPGVCLLQEESEPKGMLP